MSDADIRREQLAEAVVFAHDVDVAQLGDDDPQRRAFEHTAALALAAFAQRAVVPSGLQVRLAASGLQFCAERRPVARPVGIAAAAATDRRPWVAFACGLAAGITLFLLPALRSDTPPAADRLRAQLLAADTAAVRVPWRAGPSPMSGDVRGDVLWSAARQEGYLTFRGLPPLDAEHRFQLWIVDGSRTGAPVDGGLFAIADADQDTVVPVRATLPIGRPAAFVVTVEAKAGAVVSAQEHVVAIAGL